MSRPRPRRTAAGGITAVAILLAVAGCGVPQDREPQALTQRVPAQLLGTVTSTTIVGDDAQEETLYLVQAAESTGTSEGLRPVTAAVPAVATPGERPRAVLERLLDEPTPTAQAMGAGTAIPENMQILDVSAPDAEGVVTVNQDGLNAIEGLRAKLAAAQIVFTLTQLDGVDRVRFKDNGEDIEISTDGGSTAQGQPVSRADYPDLQAALDELVAASTSTSAPPTTVASLPAPPS
jgi:spore germination protein GerM